MALECVFAGRCGGCPWWDRSAQQQVEERLTWAQKLFPEVTWKRPLEAHLRDRADLVWQKRQGKMHLGLYGLDVREITDLTSCLMMSEALEEWFQRFRERAPAIERGSVRLRVSPSGDRGVWLDFANQDVKSLFDEREYLEWLSTQAIVEIGQRRKRLVWREGQPKLADPELRPWFQTYGPDEQTIPLYGVVGGFSQPGFAINRHLVEEVVRQVESAGLQNWIELFCGNGNFLLALAARDYRVEGFELDPLALAGLERSIRPEWTDRVSLSRTDVYLKAGGLPSLEGRGLIADPPRSGLREVLAAIERGRPSAIVYVSCFSESFERDSARLKELGYRLTNLTGVDQFPHTPHAEWVALFQI